MKTLIKRMVSFVCIAVVSITMLTRCGDMNDINQKYLDKAGRIYAGIADSLIVHGGANRVQIVGLMNYAKTAEHCIIRYTNGNINDSVRIDASNWTTTGTMMVIINDLEEDAWRFFVQTYDKDGNSSLNVECNGYSYGERYVAGASDKFILSMTPESDGIVLTWSDSDEATAIEIQYEDETGEIKSRLLPGDESSTVLESWKGGGFIESRTRVIPEKGALDMFYTPWKRQYFPEINNDQFVADFAGSIGFPVTGFLNNPVMSGWTQVTCETWVKVNKFEDAYPFISSIMGGASSQIMLRFGDPSIAKNQAQLVIFGATIAAPILLETDVWYHIAGTWDGVTAKLYVDGVLEISRPITGTINLNAAGAATDGGYFILGQSNGTRFLDGSMREVRIWNVARTQDELLSYRCDVDPDTPGLMAYWKFNEGKGTLIKDYSPNKFDIQSVNNNMFKWNLETQECK